MGDLDLHAIEWGPKQPWAGGECPVSGPVKVWFRGGGSRVHEDARDAAWHHDPPSKPAMRGLDITDFAIPAEPAKDAPDPQDVDPVLAIRTLMVASGVRWEQLRPDDAPVDAGQPPEWGRALTSAGGGRCPVPGDEEVDVWNMFGWWATCRASWVDWREPVKFRRRADVEDYDLGVEETYKQGVTRLDVGVRVCRTYNARPLHAQAFLWSWVGGERFRRVLTYAEVAS